MSQRNPDADASSMLKRGLGRGVPCAAKGDRYSLQSTEKLIELMDHLLRLEAKRIKEKDSKCQFAIDTDIDARHENMSAPMPPFSKTMADAIDVHVLASKVCEPNHSGDLLLHDECLQSFSPKVEDVLPVTITAKKMEEAKKIVCGPRTDAKPTSVMMRNIPNNYMVDQLLKLINENGFEKSYDFVYLPVDLERKCNVGYAFINFVAHEWAVEFRQRFTNFRDWGKSTQKVCVVAWGRFQGWNAHVEQFRNSAIMHSSVPVEYKPKVFKDGEAVAFPHPTKRIRAPKRKD